MLNQLWLFPFTFSFINYFFETAVQKCSPELCESHKKRLVMEFIFGRLQLIKKGFHQRFFPVAFVKFFRTILSRTNFGESFCFRGWPCTALSKQKATLLKLTLLHGCFSRFLNGTNGTKSRNAPQMSSSDL